MGMSGCNLQGSLNDSKFSEPLPWIGIYVAAASLACLIGMAADALCVLRCRQFWFPCRYFSLNATSLALIAIAMKLPVDLNTSMPRRQDQLSKLSSTVLVCTIMGNFMPSLGTMENIEIWMNMLALGILIFTIIVNVCIQMGTGVIYIFQLEHAVIMFFMLVQLVILAFSALTVPTTRQYLQKKYRYKHQLAMKESPDMAGSFEVKKMKEDLKKYWTMAYTCSPQYVMARSVTCTASGVLCLLCALILTETMLRSYMMAGSLRFCNGKSDYKWSTTLILIIQSIAVGVGTIAPACRWFNAIILGHTARANRSYKMEFKVENFWVQRMVQWKECPTALFICGRQFRKFFHDTKNLCLDFCIGTQTVIVLVSKSVQLTSILFVSLVSMFLSCCCCCCCKGLSEKIQCNISASKNESELDSQPSKKLNMSRFVLHLEGEEKLVELIMNSCDATYHWIRRGNKKQPHYLIKLLEKSTASQGFKGVGEFDNDQVPSLHSEEPPNCWALPVVTLTSIILALPNMDHDVINGFVRGVSEGLRYVRLIEDNLDANGGCINIRKAADIVWLRIDLYNQWQDEKLHKMALEGQSPKEIIERLADAGKNRVMEFKNSSRYVCVKENPLEWPIKVIAANSMYRLSQAILQDYDRCGYQMVERLFERLSVMTSDILGACLTNLPRVISMKCYSPAIEEGERNIREATCLLGETEEILKTLEQQGLSGMDPDQIASIDNWHFFNKKKNPSSIPSSLSNNELYLSIE
ncbi:hypothetical protein HHK36_027978 [Tetracentron sinense]|uniref:Uncharacterized protein n=1 Tax=Tetracentron sinense TaxID=13715 RepID=A0A834YJ26_TETSI|nr:hypothetical protein HHK36_027978 [Tetracentron sinense]